MWSSHADLLVVLRRQKQNPGAVSNRGLAEMLTRSLQRLPGTDRKPLDIVYQRTHRVPFEAVCCGIHHKLWIHSVHIRRFWCICFNSVSVKLVFAIAQRFGKPLQAQAIGGSGKSVATNSYRYFGLDGG